MGECTYRGRREPAPTASRSWLLATGIAITAGLALLWSAHEKPYPLPIDARVITRAASETTRITSLHPTRLPSSAATALPWMATATGEPPPATAEPANIANNVARLLSGAPDLDIGRLHAMIDIAQNPALPLVDRVTAARWLARTGDDKAVDVLEHLLLDDTSLPIRTAIATALGESPHPDATRILVALLEDEDLDVVLGAISGLAMQRDPGATLALTAALADDSLHDEVRSAAAAALGHHDDTERDLRLVFESAEGELASGALVGLAHQPFTESEPIFRELLADPNIPLDMKVKAIDALGEGTPEAADLLLELAQNAADPTLRSTAIEALALFDEPGTALDALGVLVLSEPSAEVRADFYNTLSLHADMANAETIASKLVLSTLSETAPGPQLEGYRMVASMLHDQYQPGLAATFDKIMVTWLQESAEYSGDRYTRHLSVDALRLAHTPGAHQALLDLSYSTDPAVSQLADKALRLTAKTGGFHAP